MTILEIAGKAEVSRRTVSRIAAKLFPDKVLNGKRTIFTHDEVARIVAEIKMRGKVMMGPRQSVQVAGQSVQVTKLPNGAQLREIRILWEKKALTRQQVAAAMGLPPEVENKALAVQLPPTPQEREEAIAGLLEITNSLKAKVTRGVAGATNRILAKAQTDQTAERKNYRLGFEGKA